MKVRRRSVLEEVFGSGRSIRSAISGVTAAKKAAMLLKHKHQAGAKQQQPPQPPQPPQQLQPPLPLPVSQQPQQQPSQRDDDNASGGESPPTRRAPFETVAQFEVRREIS